MSNTKDDITPPSSGASEQSSTGSSTSVSASSSKPSTTRTENVVKEHWYPDLTMKRRIGPLRTLPFQPKTALIVLGVALVGGYFAQNLSVGVVAADLYKEAKERPLLLATLALIVMVIGYILNKMERSVYLVDFAVTLPRKELMTTRDHFINISKKRGDFSEDVCAFQERLIQHSGIGDQTYLSSGVLEQPPVATIERAREECVECFTNAFDQLFERTKITPKDIDVLIVTCSLFNPTPSITSMISNHYKLRSDCKNYNLGGMGCSAGLVAVELAQTILKTAKRGTKVVIFSHENLTLNWYLGTNKGMLIPNLLFRLNGAAMYLTNEFSMLHRPKYRLKQCVRIYETGEQAHHAVYQQEDADGKIGVILAKDLVDHVTKGLMKNFYYVGLKNLPFVEQGKYIYNAVMRKFSDSYKKSHPPFVPNFSSVFKHYCIHCGGRAIIDGIQKNLSLSDEEVEPSRAALYRFGNTSSASLWYEMNYIELAGNLRAGDKVFQLTFGSGLKVNSAVWETL